MNRHLDYSSMKAISIWQPWAWLIINGHKTIETRSWIPPANLIGERIAIHAALRLSHEAVRRYVRAFSDRRGLCMPGTLELLTGSLVGTVELVEVREYSDANSFFMDGLAHLCTDPELFEPTRYGWVLANPVIEDSPVPLRGRQGFFNVPELPDEPFKDIR